MRKTSIDKKDFAKELVKIIRTTKDKRKLLESLSDYHERDIAEAIAQLTETERKRLYAKLGARKMAEIFSYLEDVEPYIEELPVDRAAKVVSFMDADDALDVLDDLQEEKKQEIVSRLESAAQKDVRRL
ncbi:MAG: magnesium transporter MgtE N-terminal domain-containing protein, partial [Acutalibacteraceae bacterium]